MRLGVAKSRSEDSIATDGNFTESYETRSRRAAVSFNYYSTTLCVYTNGCKFILVDVGIY